LAVEAIMTTRHTTWEGYRGEIPLERLEVMDRLVHVAREALLPLGFEESVGKVGVSYVVPLQRFPAGYHCTPGEPLPFVTLASQARHLALYHMGLYMNADLLVWFQGAYADAGVGRLDMGKSCIRWSRPERVPLALVGELLGKISADRWVELYQRSRV